MSIVVVIDAWPRSCFHAFHSGAAPQQPGRVRVPVLVGPEVDAGAHPQAAHQVVDGGVGPRVPLRLRPQVDEHVVRIQGAVLAVEVVDIQPHQLRRWSAPSGTHRSWRGRGCRLAAAAR